MLIISLTRLIWVHNLYNVSLYLQVYSTVFAWQMLPFSNAPCHRQRERGQRSPDTVESLTCGLQQGHLMTPDWIKYLQTNR